MLNTIMHVHCCSKATRDFVKLAKHRFMNTSGLKRSDKSDIRRQ